MAGVFWLRGVAMLLCIASMGASQGAFVNFESPQVKPITVATVGGVDHLLVCNTPDNSLEIYTATVPCRFVKRVPVGLRPVTVRWHAARQRAYVVNHLGDSVTMVHLSVVASRLKTKVERTVYVGDEPCDVAFVQTGIGELALVTLSGQSGVLIVRPGDFSLVLPWLNLLHFRPPLTAAIKAPRCAEGTADGRFVTANFMGGNNAYDFDLFLLDPHGGALDKVVGGLGTTHHAFAISRDNPPRAFVVGTLANNLDANEQPRPGRSTVRGLKTGFVQSHLWIVDLNQRGQQPTRVPEALAGQNPPTTFRSINLNRDYTSVGLNAIGKAKALSQPTDVALWEGQSGVEKVIITAMHSDTVAILTPDPTSRVHGGWKIDRVAIQPLATGGYGMAGPRGLAISYAATYPGATKLGLAYVLNRLDNSVSVIDPHNALHVTKFALQNDPTSTDIRAGRRFLYDARISGTGTVSCASCHVDATTDGLPWDLSAPGQGNPIDPWMHDGDGFHAGAPQNFHTNQKGIMITQTLQGLVDHPVDFASQYLFTNAPYHWRGDKASFEQFNEAYVNLMNAPNQGGLGENAKGVTDGQMRQFAEFINTVRHPPNPEQRLDRRLSGTVGDPDTVAGGGGAARGLKLFAIQPIAAVNNRSCIQCHQLPDGSSNTLVLREPRPGGAVALEAAAMRNLRQREMLISSNFKPLARSSNPGAHLVSVYHGLLHSGGMPNPFGTFAKNINDVVGNVFAGAFPAEDEREALIEFTRTFDSGVAPSVGGNYTITHRFDPLANTIFAILESQVEEANSGLAVYVTEQSGRERGFYYDLTTSRTPPYHYREEGRTTTLSRSDLIAIAGTTSLDDVVILNATAVGSERRMASRAGVATTLRGPSATAPVLQPMAAPTHWVDVTKFDKNWDPNHPDPSKQFEWSFPTVPTPPGLNSIRTLQTSVAGRFGFPALTAGTGLRHQPPRRFRVVEPNGSIRHGAKLLLGINADPLQPKSSTVNFVSLPLFPTRYTDSSGNRIWETTVEADARMTLALMNGGLWAPDVMNVMRDQSSGGVLAPQTWNYYLVVILNEDGTITPNPTWQRLSVQDGR